MSQRILSVGFTVLTVWPHGVEACGPGAPEREHPFPPSGVASTP